MPKPRAQGLGLATSSEAMAVSLTAVQRPGKLHAFQFQIISHQQIQKNLESQLQFLDSLDFLDSRFRFQIQINGRTLQWLGQAHVCLCLCLFVRAQVDTATWSRGRCVCRMSYVFDSCKTTRLAQVLDFIRVQILGQEQDKSICPYGSRLQTDLTRLTGSYIKFLAASTSCQLSFVLYV